MLGYFLTCSLILNASLPVAQALGPGDVTGVTGPTGGAVLPAGPGPWVDPTIITENGAIIDWSNFNTVGGETVTFDQRGVLGGGQSPTSAVLNRITGAATQFDGALSANGRVFIVNPAGIVFGSGSTVNVAQLVASGLHMSNFSEVANDPTAQMRFEGGNGDVTNHGIITAGSVYLIGKKVGNGFAILAPNGSIVLAAGDNVYLAQDGSNVVVQVSGVGDGIPDVKNSSRISAENGSVVLAAGDTFSRAVSNTGIITADGGTVGFRAARITHKGVVGADGFRGGDAGSVTLSAVDEVLFYPDIFGNPPAVTADGGANGDGGTITIEASAGSVDLLSGSIISAVGGSTSGDGGYIKITGEHFTVDPSSHIDASPQNMDFAPGTLEIDPAIITVANGASLGATDTIYEQDIENLSTSGTNVKIVAEDAVNVQDMTDDGEITGGVGGIELQTGPTGSVSFANTGNTISTTRGNIAVSAGSGGANIGNLRTGDPTSTPGQISVTTANGGDVSTGSLTITDGLGRAEISVDASGNLIVNGDVEVGSNSAINNVPSGQDAEAIISLIAGGSVVLNGDVDADAHATNPAPDGGVTKADIQIRGGTDVTIDGGALVATAQSPSNGRAYASIEIEASGHVSFEGGAPAPIADGDGGEVRVVSYTTKTDPEPEPEPIPADVDVARVIIDQAMLQALPDFDETHMGSPLTGNVLDNDTDPDGDPIIAALDSGPSNAASFTLNPDGSYDYTPNPGYVGDDTFTYTATAGGDTSAPVLVTITMTNTLPTAGDQTTATHMGVALAGTVADNILDADGDPLSTALVTNAVNGTLTLNPDGTYSYAPNAGYVGPDSFTYSVADPEIGAVPAQATVTINVTNTLPVLNNDAATTNQNTNVGGNVLTNDVDADGDPLTAILVTGPANAASFTLNPDGSFSYKPADGFIGEDSFTYSASDPQLIPVVPRPGQATVTITVKEHSTTAPPAAPGVDVRVEPEISGYPALVKWVAVELGVDEKEIDVWFANTLASARDIPPYDAYSSFKKAARILQDRRGVHTDALAQVISEFASDTAPPTEEQMASIAEAIARDTETGSVYALAGLYLDSLAEYVNFLVYEIGFSEEDAVELVTTKYVDQLAEKQNVGLAAYVAVRLTNLYEDRID